MRMQEKVLAEIQRIVESFELEYVIKAAFANTGTVYVQRGFDTALEIQYDFQDDYMRLNLPPARQHLPSVAYNSGDEIRQRFALIATACREASGSPMRTVNNEVVVQLADGWSLRSGATVSGLTSGEYVRLVKPNGTEYLYWDQAEWETDPALVMGAIINSAAGLRISARVRTGDAAKHAHCRHCGRVIEERENGWASPDADNSDDDPYRCEDHDTFVADHEPEEEVTQR